MLVSSGRGSDDLYFIDPAMKDYWAIKKRLRQVTIRWSIRGPAAPSRCADQSSRTANGKVKCWKTAHKAYEHSKTDGSR